MIAYELDKSLYLNITNRCTNRCNFCIRNFTDGIGEYELWLENEPMTEEIIDAIGDPTKYEEIVFCGYGEPLLRLQIVIDVSKYIKKNYPNVLIRVNTNGQANLIYKEDITPQLKGCIDIISISLNAENAQKYHEICQSEYGEEAFYSILEFTRKCKAHVPKVVLSVVDLPEIDIEKCRQLADELETELKIRNYEEG